jgi:hypothetical protein
VRATCFGELLGSHRQRTQDLITRFRAQAGEDLRRVEAPKCGRKGITLGFTVFARPPPVRREPALHDRALEQPIAAGRH